MAKLCTSSLAVCVVVCILVVAAAAVPRVKPKDEVKLGVQQLPGLAGIAFPDVYIPLLQDDVDSAETRRKPDPVRRIADKVSRQLQQQGAVDVVDGLTRVISTLFTGTWWVGLFLSVFCGCISSIGNQPLPSSFSKLFISISRRNHVGAVQSKHAFPAQRCRDCRCQTRRRAAGATGTKTARFRSKPTDNERYMFWERCSVQHKRHSNVPVQQHTGWWSSACFSPLCSCIYWLRVVCSCHSLRTLQ
jgi:hypothetical protein